MPAGVAQDAAGNTNTLSTSTDNQVFYTQGPIPTVTPQSKTVTDANTVVFTVKFDEQVTGFTDTPAAGTYHVIVGGRQPQSADAGIPVPVGTDGTTYTVTVTKESTETWGDGTVTLQIPKKSPRIHWGWTTSHPPLSARIMSQSPASRSIRRRIRRTRRPHCRFSTRSCSANRSPVLTPAT